MIRRPPRSTLFPYTNALPIYDLDPAYPHPVSVHDLQEVRADAEILDDLEPVGRRAAERFSLVRNERRDQDRKSTRLNSSHLVISYAVFCLKKKTHMFASTIRA